MLKQKNRGFTLIELLITTSLTVLLLLGISALFMTFLLSNTKMNALKTIKQEGNFALSQIEFLIKNALYLDESINVCSNNMPNLTIVSKDAGTTTFSTLEDADDENHKKIASNSAFLTSSTVSVSQDLSFDCSGEVGNRAIKISFGLEKVATDVNTSQTFTTSVNMRN